MSASDREAAITTAARVACGRLLQQPGHEHQHQDDRPCPDQPGELGLRAGLLGHGRARATRADREALEQARADVRRADADHLLVAVDLLPRSRRERRSGGDRVSQRHQRDAESSRNQEGEVRHRARPGEGRQPLWQGPDERNPMAGEIERRGRGDRGDDRDQHAWDAGPPALEEQDQREADHPYGSGGGHRVPRREPADELPHLVERLSGIALERRIAGAPGRAGSAPRRAPGWASTQRTSKPARPSGFSSETSTASTSAPRGPSWAKRTSASTASAGALEHGLDRPVGAVAHPARDPALGGAAAHRVAEEDALDAAMSHDAAADGGCGASVLVVFEAGDLGRHLDVEELVDRDGGRDDREAGEARPRPRWRSRGRSRAGSGRGRPATRCSLSPAADIVPSPWTQT